MPEHNDDYIAPSGADSPLVAALNGPELTPEPSVYSGDDISKYLPNYKTIECGVGAIVESGKEGLSVMNSQIDLLPVSDDCKAFLKKELPYIAKDIIIIAIKGGWYTLTSSSSGEAIFEVDLTSSMMQGMQEAITSRIGGSLAQELFDRNVGNHIDPMLEPYTDVKVSAIMSASVKILVGSVLLGGATIPYAFAKAIVSKAAVWTYNNKEDAKSHYERLRDFIWRPST